MIIASFIARAIGLVYRIPLSNALGDIGNTYYSTANEIYVIILMISSFSLPLAVSKLISERLHRGETRNAYAVFLCALKFGAISGGVMALFTFLMAGTITGFMKFELASYALQVLSPAIFISAIVGVLRGFFQGHQTMVPSAVSQVIEQIVNAITSIICAYSFLSQGLQQAIEDGIENGETTLGPAYGAAGGTAGTLISLLVALLFMFVIYKSHQRIFKRQLRRDKTTHKESEQAIYREILITIIPIVLSTVIYNINHIIGQGLFGSILLTQGFTEAKYSLIWGPYANFRIIMNIPLAIASCLSPAIVPALAAAMVDKDYRLAGSKIKNTIRYSMVIIIPCAVGMAALADPIFKMIFPESAGSLATGIVQAGALMIVFLSLSTLTTGILQGLGEMRAPLINSGIALIIFIISTVIMLRSSLFIYAIVYSNVIFGLVVCLLNAWAIKRCIGYRQELIRTFILPTAIAGIMGIIVYGTHSLFDLFAGNAISTMIAVLVGILVYGTLLVKLRGVTERELLGMPKGELLVNLLKKCRVL